MAKIDTSRLEYLYKKHGSLSKVAHELGCSKEGVRIAMKRIGLHANEPIKYIFNEKFFSKDNEASFYWAGFIAADGCVKIKKNSRILTIALSIKDKAHLERFKYDIESNHSITSSLVKKFQT